MQYYASYDIVVKKSLILGVCQTDNSRRWGLNIFLRDQDMLYKWFLICIT